MANYCAFEYGSDAVMNVNNYVWSSPTKPNLQSLLNLYNSYRTFNGNTFDADSYNLKCVAFPSSGGSGDSLIAIGARVAALETSNVNLQNQVTAFSAGSITQAPNPEIVQGMSILFGAALLAGVTIYGLKQIYRLLHSANSSD